MKTRFRLFVCLCLFTNIFTYGSQNELTKTKDLPNDSTQVVNLKEQIVVATKVRRMALSRLPIPLLKTPASMSVIESDILKRLNITNILNLDKVTTGLRVMNVYGGFTLFRARGLDGVTVLSNGIRDERFELYSSAPTSSFVGVDRVEVLKGPASAISGYSSIGGIVSIVYNQPSAVPSLEARIGVGSWNTYSAQIGKSAALSSKVNMRFDYTGISSDGWRGNYRRSHNAYMAFDYTPNDKNKFLFSFIAYDNRVHTDPGIPRFTKDIFDKDGNQIYSIGDIPKGIDQKKINYTYVDDHLNDKHFSTTNSWEHLFNENWKLKDAASFSFNKLSYLQSEEFSHLTSTTPGIYSDYYMNGNNKVYISVDSIVREPFHFDYNNYYVGNQFEVQGKINKGGMKHTLSMGYDMFYVNLKRFQGSNFSGPATSTVMSLYNPITNPGYLDAKFTNVVSFKELYNSIFVYDYTEFNDRLAAMISLRYNLFTRKNQTDLTNHKAVTEKGTQYDLNDNALTYKLGLIYRFAGNSRIYASVSNFFRPIRTVGSDNYVYVDKNGKEISPNSSGKVYVPEKGIQYEAGIHSNVSNILSIEFSAYYIKKSNMVQTLGKNADNKTVFGQVGEVTSKGIEFETKFSPTDWFDLHAGYALTIAKMGEYSSTAIANSSYKGNYLVNAPKHTAFGWAFFNGKSQENLFRLGIGFDYSSKSYADLANKMSFNPAFVGNAMASYTYKQWTLQANINNIFDKRYAKAAENSIQWLPEPGRNFMVTAIIKM